MKEETRLHIWKVVDRVRPALRETSNSLEDVFRWAIYNGDLVLITTLTEAGYPVAGRTAYGRGLCPLLHAAWWGKLEVIDHLISIGATVHDEDACYDVVMGALVERLSPHSGLAPKLSDAELVDVARHLFQCGSYTDTEHASFAARARAYGYPLLATHLLSTAPAPQNVATA